MITNERQYRITKAEVARFEQALARSADQGAEIHPILKQAMREGLESQLEELREQVAEYEALRSGRITALDLDSLTELPDALIRARTAAGVTQRELARRLGLKEQQIQRYEATRYAGVTLERMQDIAVALGVRIHERVIFPSAANDTPAPDNGTPSGLADALARAKLTLRDLADRLHVPRRFALKLQRGRIEPGSLPDRFVARLGTALGVSPDEARGLAGAGMPGGRDMHFRAQGPLPQTAAPARISFREALSSCPDLTPEQRREWLEASE